MVRKIPLAVLSVLIALCGSITDVLDGLSVSGNGTNCLTVTFSVKDALDIIKLQRTVTVTYDAAMNSYVYDRSTLSGGLRGCGKSSRRFFPAAGTFQ